MLGLEDSASRMNRLGRSELNYGRYSSVTATLRSIEDVTTAEVNTVARKVLSGQFCAAVLGPHRTKRSLPQQLRAIAG